MIGAAAETVAHKTDVLTHEQDKIARFKLISEVGFQVCRGLHKKGLAAQFIDFFADAAGRKGMILFATVVNFQQNGRIFILQSVHVAFT